MIVIKDNNKYSEYRFPTEAEYESEVFRNSRLFFGPSTLYIDAKKRIDTESFGGSIPDGFLFDFTDRDNPEFYLIEVEIVSHDFFKHIFPQITKFFAFFKNQKSQRQLVTKIYDIFSNDDRLRKELTSFIGEEEIFKFLTDLLENSQNILLVIDGEKAELPEIIDTYSDTWGKIVKVIVIKKYVSEKSALYTVEPEFENIDFVESMLPGSDKTETGSADISENYHFEKVKDNVKEVYRTIKTSISADNSSIIFNPQKYYISIKNNRNIAFLKIRQKKIRLILMMSESEIRNRIQQHPVTQLSDSVQRFYNGPCAAVDIENTKKMQEILDAINVLIERDSGDE